ncbi:MAG: hypothetical protein ACK5MZ_06105 [Aestuariibaculum sp.]
MINRLFSKVNLDAKAFFIALSAMLFTVVLVLIGSRNLQNYDAALVAYLFGTLFALFGIVYRYSVWIQRPPTKVYFWRSMKILFSKDFLYLSWYSLKDCVRNIVYLRFIIWRGKKRGLAHLTRALGCTMAFAIPIWLT